MASFICPECRTRSELVPVNHNSQIALVFPMYKCPQCGYYGEELLSKQKFILLIGLTLVDLLVFGFLMLADQTLPSNYFVYRIGQTIGVIFLIAPFMLAKDLVSRVKLRSKFKTK
jgi:hypothetical protein